MSGAKDPPSSPQAGDYEDDDLLDFDVIETAVVARSSLKSVGGLSSEEEGGGGGGGQDEEERAASTTQETASPMGTAAREARSATEPTTQAMHGSGSTSQSDDDASLRDDYEGKYTITPVLDLERLRWTREKGDFWVPCRILTMTETALEKLGDSELKEGEVWVRYFPTSNTDKKEHTCKKERDLVAFNFQEEGGAMQWSQFYKAKALKQVSATKKKKKKGRPLYTHDKWSKTMDYAEKTLQASLAELRAREARIEHERQLAATLEVVSDDEEDEAGREEGQEGHGHGEGKTSDGGGCSASPAAAGKRKGRGTVFLRVGDQIQFKSRLEKAGRFYTAYITKIEPKKKSFPLTLNVREYLDLDVYVQKKAKYLPRRGAWQEVKEESRKFMPLGDHDYSKGGEADERLLELLGPSKEEGLKRLVREQNESLREDAQRFLRGEVEEEEEEEEEGGEEGEEEEAVKGGGGGSEEGEERQTPKKKKRRRSGEAGGKKTEEAGAGVELGMEMEGELGGEGGESGRGGREGREKERVVYDDDEEMSFYDDEHGAPSALAMTAPEVGGEGK